MAQAEKINVMGKNHPGDLLINVSELTSMSTADFKQKSRADAKILSDWLWGNLPRQTTKKIAEMLR